MKKALTILAAISLFSAFAAAADKTSSDAIGVIRIEVPAGSMRLIGCPFQSLSGKPGIGIQGVLPQSDLYADKEHRRDKCDQIYVWHGNGYDIYTFMLNAFSGDGRTGRWVDQDGLAAKVEFKPGDAFFYRRSPDSPATTLILSGQAPLDDSTYKHPLPTKGERDSEKEEENKKLTKGGRLE